VITFRDYQQEGIRKALLHLDTRNEPVILQAATGAGKSVMIAGIAKELDAPVLVLQPSKELLEQNYEKIMLLDTGIDVGMFSASVGKKDICQVTYATIQSAFRCPKLFKDFKYVIIDECHQFDPKNKNGMYNKFLRAIGSPKVIGLTATPYRLQQKYFEENGQLYYTAYLKMINRIHPFFWKSIIFKIETAELIEQGYLCPIKYRSDEVDWDSLELTSTGKDFTEDSMDQFWDDHRLEKLAKTIKFIDTYCQRNLIFCSSLRQAGRAQKLLSAVGIQSYIVSGTTPKIDRERLVREFRTGEFKHMINVGVFTTGFDVPELDSIVIARPTMSLALYYQMVGRGVRIDPARPDKMLRVFDFAGVVTRLGKVETIRLAKEEHPKYPGFFMDMVESEVGRMDEKPLFTFRVKKKMFNNKEKK